MIPSVIRIFERAPLAAPPTALTAAAAAELKRDKWPTRVRVAVSDALAAMLHGLGYAGG